MALSSRAVHTAIVIPALDEQDNVPPLIESIRRHLPDAEIVIVDNGSTDATSARAEAAGATVVSEPQRGYGAACQAGIATLAQRDEPPDILCILDADRADDPGFLTGFVWRIENDRADLVLSSRTVGATPGAMSIVQRYGNSLQTALLKARYGLELTDMGPMRAIRFSSLLDLQMEDRTWGWNVEMACKAAAAGLRIDEVPVTYRTRQAGRSKISGSLVGAARASGRILWAMWRYAR